MSGELELTYSSDSSGVPEVAKQQPARSESCGTRRGVRAGKAKRGSGAAAGKRQGQRAGGPYDRPGGSRDCN